MEDDIFSLLDPTGALRQRASGQATSQGLTSLGLGLLRASRGQPGQGRPSIAQAIGEVGPVALQNYQQSFDKTLTDALKNLQVKDLIAKREEEKRMREAQQTFQQRVAAATTMQPPGIVAGAEQQAALMNQMRFPGEQGVPTEDVEMTRQALTSNLPRRAVTDEVAANQAVLDYLRIASPVEYAKLIAKEPKALPASIQEYNFAVGQGFQGTFQDFITQQKKAGAPSTTITLPGDKKMAEVLGSKGAERLDTSLTQAQEAQSTIQNINELRPILAEGVFAGPLSAAPRAVAQIASSLGITGKDTKELLDRTAVAMQGLAKFELSAAAAMRGQGAITENERMLIQRAAGGRLDQFTAPEVQSLLTAMEKTANYRIASHNRQLDVLRRSGSPEVRDLVPFYELGPMNVVPTPTVGGIKKYNEKTGKIQ
jgi:glycosyltransferase A (GT-A) superfamily protein (DUF2064 family)